MVTKHETLLEQMGITTWRASQSLPGAKIQLNYQCYRLNDEKAFVIVENGADMHNEQSTLFQNMMQAVGFKLVLYDKLSWKNSDHILLLAKTDTILSEFGDYSGALVSIHHPEMLMKSGGKRKAWEALISFKNSL